VKQIKDMMNNCGFTAEHSGSIKPRKKDAFSCHFFAFICGFWIKHLKKHPP